MRTATGPGADAVARNHLARLCRGFLLARDEDPRRAQAFLLTFLAELRAPVGPLRPEPPRDPPMPPSPHAPTLTPGAPTGLPRQPEDGNGTSASFGRF